MQLPVVVGVDGSEGSLRALDWAATEAARRQLPLRVIHASLWEHYEGLRPTFDTECPAEQILADHLVASAQERAQRLRRLLAVRFSTDSTAQRSKRYRSWSAAAGSM
ncbi:universal stress protein [Streptomyces sp. NBC_00316]|uniref:universal stress protein n=1 Tax=Streptomyces sp. NBC_00316 TaxID=2975710 RepID=UPI002E2CDA1A|nr:universal stress protein [Streptomyces sp. NBC_00316]